MIKDRNKEIVKKIMLCKKASFTIAKFANNNENKVTKKNLFALTINILNGLGETNIHCILNYH